MKNKRAEKFLESYNKIEQLCTEKFGIKEAGGVATYIDRLTNARYATDRDSVLEKLNAVREIKTKIDADPSALNDKNLVSKELLCWTEDFSKLLSKKKDTLSLYLKKARSYAKRHSAAKVFSAILVILVVLAVLVGAGFIIHLIDPTFFGLTEVLKGLNLSK